MSRFLLLNFEDFSLNQDITQTIQSHTLFCICCFKKNVPLISLSSCSHASYLDRFTKPKLKPFNRVACSDCHEVLKKIHEFNNKVEENFKLLASESFDISKINNDVTNLQTKKTVDILLSPSETDPSTIPIETQESKRTKNIRTALDILNNVQRLNMGLKENDSAVPGTQILNTVMKLLGTVTDLPKRSLNEKSKTEEVTVKREMIEIEVPPVTAPGQGTSCNAQSSKINTIQLTKEELMRERSLEAQSQEYLRHPYKCETCIVGFFYEENLQDHITRKHATDAAGAVATCEVCLQVLQDGNMNAHKFRHYTRYDCTVCNRRFDSFGNAWFHADEHKANRGDTTKHKCRFCDYTTDSAHKFKMHKLRHGKFPCQECGVILMRAASRRKHMAVVHNITSFDCEKCKASFDSEVAYKNHMRTHAYCTSCNLRFLTWTAYCMHMRLSNAHSTQLRRYKCGDCGMKFRTMTQRRMHTENRHAKTHVINCKYCTKQGLAGERLMKFRDFKSPSFIQGGALWCQKKGKCITNQRQSRQKEQLAVHNAVLVPTISYRSESWVWQRDHESTINAIEMRALRKICGVTLADHGRNTDTFASEKEWNLHMEFHVEGKKRDDVIFCDHCHRAYNSRAHLIRHLESHTKKVKAKGKQ